MTNMYTNKHAAFSIHPLMLGLTTNLLLHTNQHAEFS